MAGDSSDYPHEVILWDCKTGKRLKRFYDTAIEDLGVFNKRGDHFAFSGRAGVVHVIRVGDWQELTQIHHTGVVYGLAFSALSSRLACITADGFAGMKWR